MNVKTLQIHVTALNALTVGVLVSLLRRDPDLVRELIDDEAFTDVAGQPEMAGYPREDVRAVQETLDAILRPVRTAIGPVRLASDRDA